jgi:fido (protein-threonine AMPylation protein)
MGLIEHAGCPKTTTRKLAMTNSAPRWQAHTAKDYDAKLSAQCAALSSEIVSNSARRQRIIADPRELHAELFSQFTPPDHPEYVGTYRGTPGTTLADRRMSAGSQLQPETEFEFVPPAEVSLRMSAMLTNTRAMLAEYGANDFGKLIALSHTFSWFGKIHPFLDGNGHVQRALFAAMATEFGFPLSNRFTIHPRPYDRLLALALETFTRAPKGKETEEVGLVAEYLGFFLDGPFDAPRKQLGTPSPYA